MNRLLSDSKTSSTQSIPATPYEAFLDSHSGQHVEYVGGRILTKMTTTKTHDELTGFIHALLKFYSQVHMLGKVFGDSFQMKMVVHGTIRGREPDVMFVSNDNLFRVNERFLDGPADVAVEIVSADSEERDRIEKFGEYEAAGVREYWIMDPRKRSAEFFRLGEDGRYFPVEADDNGVFRSEILEGFWLKTEWLTADEPPQLKDAFVELGLID